MLSLCRTRDRAYWGLWRWSRDFSCTPHLQLLFKQLRGDLLETICQHARFAGYWPFVIAAVSAGCLCAHHHAVHAMMGCPRPCMCHNFVQAKDHSQVLQTCDSRNATTSAGPTDTDPQNRMCAWPGPVRHVREWEHSWPWQCLPGNPNKGIYCAIAQGHKSGYA
jgi:hypothetical protein